MQAVAAGLQALSAGYESVTKCDGEEKNVRKQFKLGAARYHVTKNLVILNRELEVFEQTRLKLIDEMAPDGNPKLIDENPKLLSAFRRKTDEIRRTEHDIPGLLKVKLSALNIGDDGEEGKNPIPPDLLAQIWPLVADDTPDAPKE